VEAVGDEILSPYWSRADTSKPVSVKQLAAFHQQGLAAKFAWYNQGSSATLNTVFTALGSDGQTMIPRTNTNGTLAQGFFNPGSVFGFKVDTKYSDDTLNLQQKAGGGYGHQIRFFPLRDRSGNYVPNTWLMAVDYYDGKFENYDFQDNVYIVGNIRPSNRLPAAEGAAAVSTGKALSLDWSDVSGAVGYNVQRSDRATGKFVRVNASLLTDSSFVDANVVDGNDYFYRIVAVDGKGIESLPITASGVV